MLYFKTLQEHVNESAIQHPDLEDIRYYRGSVLQFVQYMERKIDKSLNPHGNVNYKYPKKRSEKDKSLPYQDYINGNSELVKYKLKHRKQTHNMENYMESLEEFLNSKDINESDDGNSSAELDKKVEDAQEAKKIATDAQKEYNNLKGKNEDSDEIEMALLKYKKLNGKAEMLIADAKIAKIAEKNNKSNDDEEK